MSVKSSWYVVLFKFSVSLLIFYLDFVFIVECGELKFPTIIVEFSISPFQILPVFVLCILGLSY